MLEERARSSGLTLSEWVRDVLLAAPVEPGPEAGSEVVLAELLALRSLFLNLQFRAGKEPLTEAELRGLIERADATKLERARERLQAARAASKQTQPEEVAEDDELASDASNGVRSIVMT